MIVHEQTQAARPWFGCVALLFLAAVHATDCLAQETNDDSTDRPSLELPNLPSPTLGGKQLWSDELVFHDWRIQRNAWTGHYRLLDDKNIRRAWGSFDHCRQHLTQSKRELELPPFKPDVVLVLHGLVRSRAAMEGMCDYLREHLEETTVMNVSYASARETIGEHAGSLAHVIEHLDGVERVSFVAHSMGNLVVRHYLADRRSSNHSPPALRIYRFVMLAPPNNGAAIAEQFQSNPLFKAIWGTSGMELAKKWKTIEEHLAVPDCQFGIIAGGNGEEGGGNPLIPGDDDMVVTVQETRLPGAHDFIVVPALHSTIMDDTTVRQYTERFLAHGYFVDASSRCPLPKSETP